MKSTGRTRRFCFAIIILSLSVLLRNVFKAKAVVEPLPWFVEEDVFPSESVEKLLELVKSRQYLTANEDQTCKYDGAGEETAPIITADGKLECEHPYMAPNKNRTKCTLASRIDVARHYFLTGGIEGHKEGYNLLASRLQVFNTFIFDHLNDPVMDILFRSERFAAKSTQVCEGKSYFDPLQLGIIINLPGQEVATHYDVPWLWNANRFDIPQWLLVSMQQSQLWKELRVPQVQGVAYLHHWFNDSNTKESGGEFFFYPKGHESEIVDHPSKFNSAIILDGSILQHGVRPFHPKDAPKLPNIDKGIKYALKHVGDDVWHMSDLGTGELIQSYHTHDLRISLVWRCLCFENEAEKIKFHDDMATHTITPVELMSKFREELRFGDNKSALSLALHMLGKYITYSKPQDTLIPFNYCMADRYLPRQVLQLFGCSY